MVLGHGDGKKMMKVYKLLNYFNFNVIDKLI